MSKKRIDFSQPTKDIIAARAGYRCSYPDCNATLIGPGLDPDKIENIGECAHIYAASGKGPRSNHSLNDKDLQKPENGLFLCKKHHSLIDKHSGKKYPPETLMLYKQMHEHKISEEIGHISYPLLWIKEVEVIESPILKSGVRYSFTKSTIISGSNATGKSVLIEYIYTALTGKCISRHNNSNVTISIELSNPVWKKVICTIKKGVVSYSIGGQPITFCPFSVSVVFLRDYDIRPNGDIINKIKALLGEDRQFVKNLISGADLSSSYLVSDVELETVRKKPYEIVRVNLHKKGDRDKDRPWSLGQLSGTERDSFVFDIIVGYLKKLSRYKNTLFLIDWSDINTFDGKLMNYYFQQFYYASNYFQTVAVMHTLWKDVDWSGWNLIRMTKNDNLDFHPELLTMTDD